MKLTDQLTNRTSLTSKEIEAEVDTFSDKYLWNENLDFLGMAKEVDARIKELRESNPKQ